MIEEKIDTVLTYILLIAITCIVVGAIIATFGIIDDHQCWQDNYRTEHCQKYVRNN